MTSRIKSFHKFVAEQVDNDPNPRSGSLRADITKPGESGTLKIDPTHRATLLRLARAIIRDRNTENSNELITTMKSAEKAGVRDLGGKRAETERRLRDNPLHGGPLASLAQRYRDHPATGKNLDTEA